MPLKGEVQIKQKKKKVGMTTFPAHGLKYVGIGDKATDYKKAVDDIVRSSKESNLPYEAALSNFNDVLNFEFCGLEPRLRFIQNYYDNEYQKPKRRGSKYNASGQIIDDRSHEQISCADLKKMVEDDIYARLLDLVREIDDKKDAPFVEIIEEYRKKDKVGHDHIVNLLSDFFEKNERREDQAPEVFFKCAVRSELILLARQFWTLKWDCKEGHKNIDLLDREKWDGSAVNTSSVRDSMINFIANKLDYKEGYVPKKEARIVPVKLAHKEAMSYPIEVANKQFDKIYNGGAMTIALKDPATKRFESSIIDSDVLKKELLSESQCAVLYEIEDIIKKGVGGKIKIRMATGSGKTHLVENLIGQYCDGVAELKVSDRRRSFDREVLLPNEIISLNLNSPVTKMEYLEGCSDLKRKMVILDEEYFYDQKFLEFKETEFEGVRSDGLLLKAEELKNDFIHSLKKKGAIVITLGASESLERINFEVERTKGKISTEEQRLNELNHGPRIIRANSIIYDIKKDSSAKIQRIKDDDGNDISIFQKVFPRDINGDNYRFDVSNKKFEKMKPSAWNNYAIFHDDVNGVRLRRKSRSDGEVFATTDEFDEGAITNKEFLIRTAFYIKDLCSLANVSDQGLADAIKKINESLKPKLPERKIAGKKRSQGKEKLNQKFGLDDLLEVASGKIVSRKNKGFQLNADSILEAVSDFVYSGYLESLPDNVAKADQSSSRSITKNLDRLGRKLKEREYQLEDLYQRREKTTVNKFKKTKLVVDEYDYYNSSNKSSRNSEFFEIVNDGLLNNPLEPGKKMQYILPDFDIDDETCGNEGLREVLTLRDISGGAIADIVIVPWKAEGKDKLYFKFAYNGRISTLENAEGINDKIKQIKYGVQLSEDEGKFKVTYGNNVASFDKVEDANRCVESLKESALEVNPNPKIISFFDAKNSIGGDYGDASVDIAKQYVHLVKSDCLSSLTRNKLMQYNRDRTDPDIVNYDSMDLKLIIPKSSFSRMINRDSLEQILHTNTVMDDSVHLQGRMLSKTKREPLEEVKKGSEDEESKVADSDPHSSDIIEEDNDLDDSREEGEDFWEEAQEKKIPKPQINLGAFKEDGEARSPSSSVSGEGSSKLNEMSFYFYDTNNFISYEVTPSEKKFRSNDTDEVKTIMVFKDLFDESDPDKIYDLIANIIVCAAKEKELSPSEALRMVQIVKETQSVSDATLPRDMSNPFTEEDERRVEQYEDFLGYFQELCEDCGIYSYLTEFQGLRLCNINKESDNIFKGIVEENRESFSEEILEDAYSMVNEQIEKLEYLIEEKNEEMLQEGVHI